MLRRILLVESGLGYGGSAFSLLRLAKNLDRLRYEPEVVVSHHAHLFEQIGALGINVRVIRPLRPLFGPCQDDRGLWAKARNYCSVYGNLGVDTAWTGIRLARHIRQKRIDMVHLNNGLFENLPAAFAARLAGVPCISHVRGTECLPKLERCFAGWVSAVIVLNRTVLDDYASVFGDEKVHLIHNGVDMESLRSPDPERIRREFRVEPGTFAVGTFARLVRGKGISEFISAASRVCREYRDCRFFVVGHDITPAKDFETRMKQLARDLGLGRELAFTGWRDDQADIMAAMDLVLQISTTFPEGMSLAPLEAMALGKPVIVTRIPGYESSVDHGKSGFVVEPGDIDHLVESVLMLARDRELARRMGEKGRKKAQLHFDIRLTAKRVQELYDWVLDAP